MPVTAANMIQGPAELYIGTFGATEPLDTAIGSVPSGPTWTNLGATDSGVKVNVNQTYNALTVDQIVDRAGSRLVSRVITVSTNLAEPTLANLMRVLNAPTDTPTTGSPFLSFEPANDNSATQPTYRALIADGYAPAGFRRRIIVRRVLVTDNVESTYKKDGQTYFAIQWTGHFVSSSIAPFKWVDQTS